MRRWGLVQSRPVVQPFHQKLFLTSENEDKLLRVYSNTAEAMFANWPVCSAADI